MTLVTLTTDWGMRDYYSGAFKGDLLTAIPGVTLVDVSHEIEPFNIIHGAFVLKNAYRHYPAGTIHLAGVNIFHDSHCPLMVIAHEGYFFVGPDNGLFGLVWEEAVPDEIYRVEPTPQEIAQPPLWQHIMVRVIRHLAEKKSMDQLGPRQGSMRQMLFGRPIISHDYIKGNIVFIDHFGNAVVNIVREEFEKIRSNRNFVLHFKNYHDLISFSQSYASVEESEKLCFFNAAGYLEIAINKGSAHQLLNLNVGDFVQVEFH